MNNNFDENSQFVRRPTQNTSSDFPRRPAAPNPGAAGGTRNAPQGNNTSRPFVRPGATRPSPSATRSAGTAGGTSSMKPQANKASTAQSSPPHSKSRQPEKKEAADTKKILGYAAAFFVMLALLIFLAFTVLLSTLHTSEVKAKENYTLIYGEDEDEAKKEDSVTVNGVLYFNMTRLSTMCNFTVSGSKASLRFTADKNEYIEFTVGSVSSNVNGETVNMDGAALIRENENLWIPLSFAQSYFNGINISADEETNEISIARALLENGKYDKITFKIKGTTSIDGIGEDDDIGDIQTLNFKTDLSEYEQYMNPENRDDYLILVNKTNSINQDYIPESLAPIVNTRTDRAKEQMVECAEKALEAMFIELYAAGYKDVSVTSGYRSYNKQVSLFNTYIQREMTNRQISEAAAREIVLTYSAAPGTSEHQTGLCCDMHNLPSASTAFAQKEAYTWLLNNCYKFGFILRFPENKTEITGYSFEPWHYRFVGRYHATRMNKLGYCLEEYVEYLNKIENAE